MEQPVVLKYCQTEHYNNSNVNISEIVSTLTSFTATSTQYAHVDSSDNIMKVYTTVESTKYMVSLMGGHVLQVFTNRNKILAIGEII